LTEAYYVAFQLAWAVVFAVNGSVVCAVGAAYMATAVVSVAYFEGDHASKVAFTFQWHRPPALR
jgi:hypothetical protein